MLKAVGRPLNSVVFYIQKYYMQEKPQHCCFDVMLMHYHKKHMKFRFWHTGETGKI